MTTGSFSEEVRVFKEHRDEWLRSSAGKFVAIQDSTVADGFFDTYSDALTAGLKKFGVSRSFLVKQVWKTEPVYFVS